MCKMVNVWPSFGQQEERNQGNWLNQVCLENGCYNRGGDGLIVPESYRETSWCVCDANCAADSASDPDCKLTEHSVRSSTSLSVSRSALCTPCSNDVIPLTTTILRHFFRDHPGEPVPEENFWTLCCKGRSTEADTPTIRLGATPSGLTSAHLHHAPIFYRLDALPAA